MKDKKGNQNEMGNNDDLRERLRKVHSLPENSERLKKVRVDGSMVGKGKIKPQIVPAHRVVWKIYKENGMKSLNAAIKESGLYQKGNSSTDLTKTKSWQALMNEQFPEDYLADKHRQLLDKRKLVKEIDERGRTIWVDQGPDTSAVSKGLDMAYKLRGAYKKEETPTPSTIHYNLFYKPEVREQMKTFEEGLKQSLYDEMGKKTKEEIEEERANEEAKRNAIEGEQA